MKTFLTSRVVLLLSVFVVSAACSSAAEARKEDAALSAKLFAAIQKSDYNSFVADGDDAFHGLTKAQFGSVSAAFAPRLATAHITFLGELSQHGYRVTLWKIAFSDGSDDALATLSVMGGKVGGFWIR
ncbi:MAG TPA: hypothetical protein VFE25_04385 [Opitutaceae bacterium]|jgi:hypothetical protein|nr:hypothetical protein [Opitutaceae bacterium]